MTPPASGPRRSWALPAATVTLLVAATAALTAALTLALSGADAADTSSPADSPSSTGSTESSIPGLDVDPAHVQVSELADPAWVARTARSTTIPERALAAYAGAALATADRQPGCGLGWNTLAAIGQIESAHGSTGGATLADDGNVAPAVIGVPLNGNGGVARIPDTDRGELDRDRAWDRAVGPLQFLPTTWKAYATDGNGDGTPDVHNIDDASLTAARYLCATGGDLRQPENWIAAVTAYNPDTNYNNRVARAATTYANAAP